MRGNIYFILLLLLPFLEASELSEWHMKPLGSHIKPDPVDETFVNKDDVLTAHDFATKYVIPRKPVVFRNVVKSWPAYTLWTDEYLKEKYGDMEMRLEGKKEKSSQIPKGDICLGRDTLRTFLNDYIKGADKYVVSDLPTPMWSDVYVPPPMACGEFLQSYVEIDLWINSDLGKKGNGGNSILHKDAYNTVNCVLNGTKEWKLIELQYNDYVYQSWEGPMDAGYGGYSLINPESVDANEYPNIGKIPRWQFVTINSGDCIYVPSQMWHQVKSFGNENRAVAFLFLKFDDQDGINTTGCDVTTYDRRLSDIDVDLQYPGTGVMTMGNTDIKNTREELMELVDDRSGTITKKSTYIHVYRGHADGAINKKLIREKSKALYQLLLDAAGGNKTLLTENLVGNLTRDQIRATWVLAHPIDPPNSYEHEYSHIIPELIEDIVSKLMELNGKLERRRFIRVYERFGGTRVFGERLWTTLAGDKLTVENISEATMTEALRPYEEHRRDKKKEEDEEEDDDARITTPQGHVSQPKRKKGGYQYRQKENEGRKKENTKVDANEDNKSMDQKEEL